MSRMTALLATGLVAMALADISVAAGPVALTGLEEGQWDLRSRDPAEPVQRICVKDFQQLLQLRHQGQSCKQFVVEDRPGHLTVTYNCPRTGHGRTDLRVETPRLVQIDTQGVADGFPFAMSLEARRTGLCKPLPPGSTVDSPNRPHLSIAPR